MSDREHTIIVGGGVIGVATAYYLARRGRRVTLIDRGCFDTCASTGNAGIIALGHPPMPRPGLIRQTMRMLLNPLNPLYIRPRFDAELLRWLWGFRKACTSAQFEHSMAILAELGWAAGESFDELVSEEQLECEYHTTGWLDVFQTERRFAQGRAEAELLRTYGYNVDILQGDELRQREPAFRSSVLGAAHYTDSRFANPRLFLQELAKRAAHHGAKLMTATEIQAIQMRRGRFESVHVRPAAAASAAETTELRGSDLVLAAGAWTTQLARQLGITVPMQPGKGYHVHITLPEDAPRVSTTSVMAESFVAVTPIDGGLRLAGTVELSGMNHNLVQKRLDMLRRGARAYLHGIDEATLQSSWCGLRPCTADGLPVIGPAPGIANIMIATGHAMMGFALGPITGKLISQWMLDDKPSIDLSALSPSRYARPHRPRKAAEHEPQPIGECAT